ncbi:MAG: AAA family ATPase [Halioglobus sp.]
MKLLYADNFRGFKDTIIPLSQVNFFVGENSAGKSSILGLIKLLSSRQLWQDSHAYDDELMWESFDDFVSANAKNKKRFTIGYGKEERSFDNDTRTSFVQSVLISFMSDKGRARVSKITWNGIKSIFTIRFVNTRMYLRVDQRKEQEESIEEGIPHLLEALDFHNAFIKGGKKIESSVTPSFFPLMMLPSAFRDIPEMDLEKTGVFYLDKLYDSLVWLAPIRTSPRRSYDGTGKEFSSDGKHTPYQLKSILGNRRENRNILDRLESFGKDSHLFEDLEVKKFGASATDPFELSAKINGSNLRINNVGYGVSQSLPIVIEALNSDDGSTLCIQQPEVHLHPRAQASLANVILDTAIDHRKNYIIETHSDFCIDRYRILLRRSSTNSPTIKTQIIFFENRKDGNVAHVMKLGERGELPKEVPNSYREFFIREEMDLLGL